MGTLTMNLHLLLASFYKPTETKRKILMDAYYEHVSDG
jgi:kynureninase